MNIIDLSHPVREKMPVYPGTEPPVLAQANTFDKNGFRETRLNFYSHTGTHIDAPAHMLEQGKFLDGFPVDKFYGKGVILNFSSHKNREIEINDLEKSLPDMSSVDFLIFRFDWSRYWGEPRYFEGFPCLSEKSAHWLTRYNLKGIGIDAISIDHSGTTDFPIHKILLGKEILIIENLCNLDRITRKNFLLSILPIPYKNADGSPVRAIAIENQ